MKSLQKIHSASYLILLGLTILMAIGTVVAVIQGDVSILTGGLASTVFVIFAIVQIVCITLYQPGRSVYKIGFYLMHIGLLVLLAGLAAYALAGDSITVQVPISQTGNYYRYVQNEDGEEVDLGFAFKLTDFTVEKYESGGDRYYKTDVTFADPTTLATENDYLEVNRTLRRNGWKLYLMSYSDGTANLGALQLTPYISHVYSASGADAGISVIRQIYADLAGKWYTYYYYDEINGRFTAVSDESVGALTGSLWAYTFEEESAVTVYLTRKDGAFSETLTATGSEIAAHIAEQYGDSIVNYYYYTIDMGRITEIDTDYLIGQCTDPVFAGIRVSQSGQVSVCVMKEAMTPDAAFTSAEGGSSLLADITSVYGASTITPQYRIYSPTISDYTAATEEEILAEEGVLNAYAVNMGDTLVIFVHPLSNILLLKRDPGEYATVIGMILVMVGGVMMCLFRGRKKAKDETVSDAPSADQPTAHPAQGDKRKPSKGGKQR